ncbi:EscT/YscT/HrcT family type III secretion system export apparatus protein [Verrucomicrobiota bacterium]|jgi:flagellar biosynthetic protein FliR|nr:EscT/YscT/HrcT family type III secretion system export apparatus protein [Verrucomicrobiota bacterium]
MGTAFLYLWMMAFVRAGGVITMIPVFSGRNIPMPVRIALAALLALIGLQSVREITTPPDDVFTLVLATAHELIIGLLMGLGVRLIFFALETAGQIIAAEMGLSVSAQIDPVSQSNSTPVGVALTMFGTLLFLISGAHHAVFAAFSRSFALMPVGVASFDRSVGEVFVQSTGSIFLLAVQMAAPMMAVNFVVTLTFAVLSKAAQGLNAFSESFPVRIAAGFTMLSVGLGLTAQLVLSGLRSSPELMLRLIP